MQRIFLITLIAVFFTSPVYSANVKDENKGSKGQILINSGHKSGHRGEWQDASSFKGEKGDKGDSGTNGNNGQDGTDGVDGKDGDKGNKGDTGKGLKDRHEVQFEGVIYEDAKSAISTYYIRDFNNKNNTVGIKLKYYFGKSHSEKVREELQQQIDELKQLQRSNRNNFEEDNMVVVPTETGFIMKRRF